MYLCIAFMYCMYPVCSTRTNFPDIQVTRAITYRSTADSFGTHIIYNVHYSRVIIKLHKNLQQTNLWLSVQYFLLKLFLNSKPSSSFNFHLLICCDLIHFILIEKIKFCKTALHTFSKCKFQCSRHCWKYFHLLYYSDTKEGGTVNHPLQSNDGYDYENLSIKFLLFLSKKIGHCIVHFYKSPGYKFQIIPRLVGRQVRTTY